MQTRFSDPILKTSAEYHASSTYGPEILRSGCTGWSEGAGARHRSSSVRDSWIGQVNDSTGDIVGIVVVAVL